MARQATKKRQTTEAHGEKRNEILRHCAILFDKVGYHKASMQMLADEVGLGKPTLYHYFPSKHAILYAIHEAHMSVLLDGVADKDPAANPFDRLRSGCIDILRQIAEHPGYVRAFMDHYEDLEGKMRNEIRAQRKEYFERIRGIIVLGIENKQFRDCDPDITTYGFLGMCNWAYKWYPPLAKKRSPEEVADALCGPFFEGLRLTKQ
ncbi:TetR/AcrR family transcriptional regulator [Sphingobium sp.]|uniref:TetR/AcrR family transcriptional regulator n=1 Tax=Sphingobium sp. TaxID=1912891 RepID=UPI0028BE22AF|nr:TetR/AcrR family transcriptional regulator [Sphingobium sp.]